MKRFSPHSLYLGISLLTLAFLNSALAQEETSGDTGPVIEFETPVYDRGNVNKGEKIRYDFKFFNRGDKDLVISNVRPGCGCTTAGTWTKLVAPGQSGTIPIQLDTERFKGPITKSVTVSSNDKKKPTSYLRIKANIWTPVLVEPTLAAFRSIKKLTEKQTTEIKVKNQTETPMKLGKIEITGPFEKVGEPKEVVKGKEFVITLATKEGLVYGNNRGLITIETNIPEAKSHKVNASAYVMAPVQAVPNRIMIPAGGLTKDTTKYVTVITYEDKALELSEMKFGKQKLSNGDIKSDAGMIHTEIKKLNKGKQWRIMLKFAKGFDVEKLGKDTTLKFKTNHSKFSDFSIPVGSYQSLSGARK